MFGATRTRHADRLSTHTLLGVWLLLLVLSLPQGPAWAQADPGGVDIDSMFGDLRDDHREEGGGMQGDGILDGQQDFNRNGTPDGEEDQNQNQIPDGDEDLNGNGLPDGQEDIRSLPTPGQPQQPGSAPRGQQPGGAGFGAPDLSQQPQLSLTDEIRPEEQISFKADAQRASDEDQTLQLDGNVVIYFRDMTFYCEHGRVDDAEKVFYGLGEARLEMPDRIIYGESFWYDYSDDTFYVRKAHGQFNGGLGEPVYFVSRSVRGHVKDFKLVSTTLTTCRPDEDREWHIEASMVKVLPDKKILMRNATFYFYNIPLFFFPFYDYNLEETSVIVEVGKNRTEGTFVKLRFNYLYERQDHLFGAITTSYRSRLGYTFGTDHRYAFNSKEWPGSLKTDTEFLTDGKGIKTAYSFNVSQQFTLMDDEIRGTVTATQNSRANIQAGTRSESSSANLNLTRQKQGADNMSVRYTFQQQETTTVSATSTFNFTHQHQFGKGTRIDNSVNLSSQNGSNGLANDQRLELQSTLDGKGNIKGQDLLDWSLSYRQTVDPDGNRVRRQYEGDVKKGGGSITPEPADPGNDSFEADPPPEKLVDPDSQSQTLQELPKLVMNIRPGSLGNKKNTLGIESTRTQVTLAHYVQRRSDERINAVFAEFDGGWRRNWDLSQTNRLSSTMNYKQSFTGTGDALYSYSPGLRWERTDSKILRQSVNWTYSDSEGASPITSGSGGGNNSNIQYSMNYNATRLQYSVTTGRNFINNTWSPINFQSTYTPNPGVGDLRVTFSTGYDLENDRFRPFVFQAQWTDFKRLQANLNYSYNLDTKQTDQLSSRVTWLLQKKKPGSDHSLWTEFNLNYSTVGGDSSILRDIIVTKEMDCTFWQFTYNALADSFVLYAGITAYPTKTFAYGVNASNLIQNPFQQFGEGGFGAGPGGVSGGGFNF